MSKKKKIILIVVSIVIIAIIYFGFIKKDKDGNSFLGSKSVKPNDCDFSGGRDFLKTNLPLESDIHTGVNDVKTDCQLQYMNTKCGGENWKCRKFVVAGGYIPTDYVYNDWGGNRIADGRILEWAYELHYLSGKDWASSEPYELLKQSEYQAALQDGYTENSTM